MRERERERERERKKERRIESACVLVKKYWERATRGNGERLNSDRQTGRGIE